MKKSKKEMPLFSQPVSQMSREERLNAIKDNQDLRADIIKRIESVLLELSQETGNKRYRKRKYKLGKSPNDVL